jgi:membrane-associated phospholipid phosphatase
MLKNLITGVQSSGWRAWRDRRNRKQVCRLRVEPLEDRLVLSGDMVLRWNEIALVTMRPYGLGPAVNSRVLAIVQAAVYDAVNSIDGTHTPYLAMIPAPAGASAEAAVAQAAHDTLLSIYPAQSGLLDLALKASLQLIVDGDAKTAGIQVGQTAAQNMLAARTNDGSEKMVDYIPGTNPGDYQLTPPSYLAPVSPQWPGVKPFCLQSGSQFQPPPPPALTSPEYTAAFNQIKALGSFDSTTRTADQTEAAMFYAGIAPGLGAGFFEQVNNLARTVAEVRGNSLVDNARMFALMELGLADESIANWTAKYTYNFWRPVTAIRAADTDGNPDTAADPNWTTLLATPNIPSYPSQHSSAVGSTAAILASFFGTDAISFSVSWDGMPGVTRSFNSFSAWANECGQARIWAGFHWSFDVTAGLDLGQSVGQYIAQNFLLPHGGAAKARPGGSSVALPPVVVLETPVATGWLGAAQPPSGSCNLPTSNAVDAVPTIPGGGREVAKPVIVDAAALWHELSLRQAAPHDLDVVFGTPDGWGDRLDSPV